MWEIDSDDDGQDPDFVEDKIENFTAGEDIQYDEKLLPYDIVSSAAHTRSLNAAGILTEKETRAILSQLNQMWRDPPYLEAGDEDVHTKIENLLVDKLGATGEKIHLGRSRNDQVIACSRLYMKDQMLGLMDDLLQAANSFLQLGRKYRMVPLVGYTHTRKAMPSSVGLWSCSYCESFLDDVDCLKFAFELIDQSPLGAGAGYGVPLEIDRELTARLLGFSTVQTNPLNTVNSRGKYGFVVLFCCAVAALDLSRLSADLIFFTDDRNNYFDIPSPYTTGSSIMPHKDNPDVLELIRARSSTIGGLLSSNFSLIKGLISGYHRDHQQIKKLVMDGLDQTREITSLIPDLVAGLEPNEQRLHEGFSNAVFATDRAYRKARDGQPFRQAYREVKKEIQELSKMEPPSMEKIEQSLEKRVNEGDTGNLGLSSLKRKIGRESDWREKKEKAFRKSIRETMDVTLD